MIYFLCSFVCGRRSHKLCRRPSVAAALFFVTAGSVVLPACTIARTSVRISEVGARYHYADCGELEKNVLFRKDGRYYVKARKRVCERKQDLWGTVAVALNYWGYRDVPLPDDEQPDGFVAVRVPRDLALRMSGRKEETVAKGTDIPAPTEYLQTVPEIDLAGAQELPVRHPLQEEAGCRILRSPCYDSAPPLYVYGDRQAGSLNAWMQPVAWFDAVAVDVPLSVVATPVRWVAAGCQALFSER